MQVILAISIALFFCTAVYIQNVRSISSDEIWALELLLDSGPSFFYVSGVIWFIPIVKKSVTLMKFFKLSLFVMFGALLYEAEQMWTSMVFDYADIAATFLGALFANAYFYVLKRLFD